MGEDKIKQLAKICCRWNAKEIDPTPAMVEIWDLFVKECLVEWNKKLKKSGVAR